MSNQSLSDLCKPLSAKVMPKSKRYGSDNTERSNEQALSKQRASESMRILKKLRRKTP